MSSLQTKTKRMIQTLYYDDIELKDQEKIHYECLQRLICRYQTESDHKIIAEESRKTIQKTIDSFYKDMPALKKPEGGRTLTRDLEKLKCYETLIRYYQTIIEQIYRKYSDRRNGPGWPDLIKRIVLGEELQETFKQSFERHNTPIQYSWLIETRLRKTIADINIEYAEGLLTPHVAEMGGLDDILDYEKSLNFIANAEIFMKCIFIPCGIIGLLLLRENCS